MTVAVVGPRPATMPGYSNSVELDEVHSLTSYTQPSMVSNTSGMFSFSQTTEPSADLLSGSSWATTAEGPQNFQDFSDNGSAHSGEADEFIYTSGQTTPRGTRLGRVHAQGRQDTQHSWTASRTATAITQGGQAMSRVSSSRSSGSSLSRTSHMSNMDLTGNASTFRHGSQATSTMGGIESCLLLDPEAGLTPQMPQMYWSGYPLDMTLNADNNFSMPEANANLHVVPAHMQLGPDVNLADHSPPGSWDCFSSSISRSSSPATNDDMWLPNQSPNSSPEMHCQSPSIDRKMHVMPEDLNGSAMPSMDDSLALPPPYSARRQGTEGESARDHDLYKKAAPMEDGLYHCPFEGTPNCNHKPEKLKCNYDKFVDSHLKPYRCKAEACQDSRFSSTACLLRHEREAHGLHGHGEKPFLCRYDGCERAVPGNGFPRQWNLRDHMKRVHNDHSSFSGPPTSTTTTATTATTAATSTQQTSSKGRKRKTDVAERQATSSRKASVKSMPAEPKKNSTRPLLDQWMENRKNVERLARGLGKPEDVRTIQQLQDMQKRLAIMLQVTSDLSIPVKVESMATDFVGTG